MAPRLLVPRPGGPAAATPEPQHTPTSREWIEHYLDIKRMYVDERRRLKFVMAHMEREHGFKATEQMYKKRFAKWGFQKNCKRSAAALANDSLSTVSNTPGKIKTQQKNLCIPLHFSPKLDEADTLSLSFLANVRNWNTAFFESAFCGDKCSTLDRHLERAKETSFTLKLVSDLLLRGHGDLAGRLARRAFLLVEDILMFEGPALIWNLLEIMHHTLALGHEQLFCMLLSHIDALVNQGMSKNHPLASMTRTLRSLVVSMRGRSSGERTSSNQSSQKWSNIDGTTINFDSHAFENVLAALITEAWTLNANTMFDNFDQRFLQLYSHLHWESCSIDLPPTIADVAKQWLRTMKTQQNPNHSDYPQSAKDTVSERFMPEATILQQLSEPKLGASPQLGYRILLDGSLEAFRKHWESILDERTLSSNISVTMLSIMPAVVKAGLVQGSVACHRPSAANFETTQTSQDQASNAASVIKALMSLHADSAHIRIEELPGAVERLRWVVALREYANGETDPQVMQEMWLLQDAFAAVGEVKRAEAVRQLVISRIEMYTEDIAANY